MASNRFGTVFSITTWGESHGKAIGVVIDGCPAGLSLDESIINIDLKRRAPGQSAYTTSRREPDLAEILSGVFEGMTTGAPISIIIRNQDADSTKYDPIKDVLRPGHANYSYLQKYGVFDYRGGGRASARETACRVAAGSVAKQLLKVHNIDLIAYIKQIGEHTIKQVPDTLKLLLQQVRESVLCCPDCESEQIMMQSILDAKADGDSLGGIVEFQAHGLPAGIGDPVYQKIEASLASAMMSIPAAKGFEIGTGFSAVSMKGSEHNDCFVVREKEVTCMNNHAGGVLGGISTGMPIVGRVAFKPTSSIAKPQDTIDTSGKSIVFELPKGSRHDPCVAVRAPAIVEAMAALTIADALLLNRCSRANSTFDHTKQDDLCSASR